MQDRPARPARTKPVPASDAGVDPIDYKQPAPEPQPTPTTSTSTSTSAEGKGTRSVPAAAPMPPAASTQEPPVSAQPAAPAFGPEVTVQLGTRVSIDVSEILEQAVRSSGRKKRALIEEAIRNAPWRRDASG